MIKHIFSVIFIYLIVSNNITAQELFRLDFETAKAPESWDVTDKSEWGHELGEDGSNYFRFHPSYYYDRLESPTLNLESGNYKLFFSWNEVGNVNPDYINVRISKNGGEWEEVSDFGGLIGGGTNREWRKDSAIIGNLETAEYKLQFQYRSIAKYPAQYIGLDNIYLVKGELVTGLQYNLERVGLSIFPNPVSTELTFSIDDASNRIFDAKIFSVDGKLVKEVNDLNSNIKHQVNIAELESGTYLFEIIHQDGIKTESFVKQKN